MAKNPWIAAFLSFLIGGLGQLYVGRIRRALTFFSLEIVTGFIWLKINDPIGYALNIIVGLVAVIDAYRIAKETQVPTPVKETQLPQQEYRVF
jgi:TM2 domain-containing membrane protein YozV